MSPYQRVAETKTIEELDALWARFSAAGHQGPDALNPHGGLLYQAVESRRAVLEGRKVPEFPIPPGRDLPPIHGRWRS